ncbi:MAG: hypothetical protein V4635_06195 [Bacteroidota bacterium]
MKNKILYTGLALIFLSSICSGQSDVKKNKKTFQQAERAFERADYLTAFQLYKENLKFNAADYTAAYKSGLSLFNINKTDTGALSYFNRAQDQVPEAHFYIGRIHLLRGESEKALQEFRHFKNNNKEINIPNSEVDNYIRQCEIAMTGEREKNFYTVKNVGNGINTKYPEYVPLIWNLNGSLIFTSRRSNDKFPSLDPYGQFYEDIYVAGREGDGWLTPLLLGDSLNTATHDACVAFSADGTELIIYRTDEQQTGGDLYLTKYLNQSWSTPVKLGPEINSEYLETSACFSAYGNEIIFSSNRPGGLGGRDLYRVIKFMNGRFSLPVNLGPLINTAEDEDAPFLDKNDNTLYFSSRGHNSMGEYDIFKAAYNTNTNTWSDVENMGQPVNSTNDDIYFIKQEDANRGYFTSRREGGYGDADIYEVNFSESTKVIVYCKVNTDKSNDKPEDLTVTLYNLKTGKLEGSYSSNKEYKNVILLVTRNQPYEIRFESGSNKTTIRQDSFDEKNNELNIDLTRKQ